MKKSKIPTDIIIGVKKKEDEKPEVWFLDNSFKERNSVKELREAATDCEDKFIQQLGNDPEIHYSDLHIYKVTCFGERFRDIYVIERRIEPYLVFVKKIPFDELAYLKTDKNINFIFKGKIQEIFVEKNYEPKYAEKYKDRKRKDNLDR